MRTRHTKILSHLMRRREPSRTKLPSHHWYVATASNFKASRQNLPRAISPYVAAVVGSIIFFTSVILVAGNPLISACLRMIPSSLARYTQNVLSSAT
jgi:hypothetical protein